MEAFGGEELDEELLLELLDELLLEEELLLDDELLLEEDPPPTSPFPPPQPASSRARATGSETLIHALTIPPLSINSSSPQGRFMVN